MGASVQAPKRGKRKAAAASRDVGRKPKTAGGAAWAARVAAGAIGAAGMLAAAGLVISREAFDAASAGFGLAGAALVAASLWRGMGNHPGGGGGAGAREAVRAVIYSALVIGSAALVPAIIARHDMRLDLTVFSRHTLSEPARKYLELLTKEVEIVVFDVEDTGVRGLLDRFAEAGPMVHWKLVDPRRDPVFTRGFGPDVVAGMVAVRHGDRVKKLAMGEVEENTLANAIVDVTRERDIKVYFLGGHGELAFDSVDKDPGASISAFRKFLAGRAMKIEPLNLMDKGFAPEDADAIIVAGPQRDLAEVEARQLKEYLLRGGRALVMFDPPKTTGEVVPFPNLRAALLGFGLEDRDEVIVDLEGKRLYEHPLKVPVQWFNAETAIGAEMSKVRGGDLVFSLVRKLAMTDQKQFRATPVVGSSPHAWSEAFQNLGKEISPPAQVGVEPITWAIEPAPPVAGARPAPPTRLVVMGTSEPARDSMVTVNNTAALLMLHTVNWLAERDDKIPMPKRVIQGTPMLLTDAQLKMVLILVTMLFPAGVLACGVFASRLSRRDSE